MEFDIELRGVSFAFGKRKVLSGVSFEVPKGEFLVLLGPNGGGKSTLLRLVLGLLMPLRGHIRVFGVPPVQAASRIGYVPQDVGRHGDFPSPFWTWRVWGVEASRAPQRPPICPRPNKLWNRWAFGMKKISVWETFPMGSVSAF